MNLSLSNYSQFTVVPSASCLSVYRLPESQIHSFLLELGHCVFVFKAVDKAFKAILLKIGAVKLIKHSWVAV